MGEITKLYKKGLIFLSEFIIGVIGRGRGEWSKERLSRIGIRISGDDIENLIEQVEQTDQTESNMQKAERFVRECIANSGQQTDMPITIRQMQLAGVMLDGIDIFSVTIDSDVNDLFGFHDINQLDAISRQFNSAIMRDLGSDIGPSKESRPSDRKNPKGRDKKSIYKRPTGKINSKGFR